MKVLSTSKNPGKEKKLFEFTHGVDVDAFLGHSEIQVQKAWVQALEASKIISQNEAILLLTSLEEALQFMLEGKFDWRIEDEDIHMNLERFLVERLGELGKKVHLGRSRNDLIATTLRLFCNQRLTDIQSTLKGVIHPLIQKAEQLSTIIVPGTTHLQHGQPVRFGHILASHAWALSRDLEKLQFARQRAMSTLPLGSAALGGTTLPLSLESIADSLGFHSVSWNSYDSVGDRDFILDGLDALSRLGVHLSRLAEDFIFWSSSAVSLVKLPKNWSTGSSIMPNKRNPDVPELVRAKASHLIAAAQNGSILIKGLPTSYNSDLHELKGVFIRSCQEAQKCLEVFGCFISEIEIETRRANELLNVGNVLATEVANYLAMKGLPFREAYRQTAILVEIADQKGVSLCQLDAQTLHQYSPLLDPNWMIQLNAEFAAEQRSLPGGTALQSMLKGIEKLKEVMGKF